MEILLLAAGLSTMAVIATSVVVAVIVYLRRIPEPSSAPAEPQQQPWQVEFMARVAALEVTVQGLPSLWEDERKRAERAFASARAARSKLDREREEQLESEDGEGGSENVRAEYVGGGDGYRLHAVPEGVEDASIEAARERAAALGY